MASLKHLTSFFLQLIDKVELADLCVNKSSHVPTEPQPCSPLVFHLWLPESLYMIKISTAAEGQKRDIKVKYIERDYG